MASNNQYPHLVIANVELWGHVRPVCAFAAKLVLTRDVHITMLATPAVYGRIVKEVGRSFSPKDADRLNLIRIVALDNIVEGEYSFAEKTGAEFVRYTAAVVDTYQHLLDEKPITCFATKTEFPVVPSPTTVVVDFLIGSMIDALRSLPKHKAKIVGFFSAMPSFLHLMFAPVERGGRADLKQRIMQETESSKRPLFDVAEELCYTFTDEIVQMPGFPKMYHWELAPQASVWLKGFIGSVVMSIFDAVEKSDGMLITSPEVYEPAAIADMREWFAETGRDVWAIGPLIPSLNSKESVKGEQAQSKDSSEIMKFMDETLVKHGKHSMLFISFGSAIWPPEFEKFDAFVDVVIENRIPFLLSHGSPFAQLPEPFKAKVQESASGFLTPWSPQQTVLNHPVVGWFVSHCGHNSTLEAVSCGVPLICWPFTNDQAANAINLTDNHGVAYELIEVRTGDGLKPIFRTGKTPVGTVDAIRAEAREVLAKAYGEDGARKRANAKQLQDKIQRAASDGGSDHVDMRRFLDSI
ncbi:hypothetical protein EIP91_000102 [Steccherinum ochraceum]|uniref:UDP-glycosyltransferases domain-containing protein n=1 Tax=Steccherinum ochraceum TaxID=92696 RepID=A0A4R0RSN2_9APHY|nr:hypothetical protein EIP91_000102 [Steccherinum ochraceum]